MKKIVLAMIALFVMTAAMAQQSDNKQQRGPRKHDAKELTERMAKELSLSDEQKSQLLTLNTEYQDVLGGGPGMHRGPHGGHHGQRPDRPQMTDEQKAAMKQRMEKRQEYEQKLKGILTGEQQKQYQKMQHHRRPEGPRGKRHDKQDTHKD